MPCMCIAFYFALYLYIYIFVEAFHCLYDYEIVCKMFFVDAFIVSRHFLQEPRGRHMLSKLAYHSI